MSMLRGIRDDLVEKRLWPVALLLVIGLIASPILALRATSGAAQAPPSPSAPAPAVKATPSANAPANLTATPEQRTPKGAYHDPFRNSAPADSGSSATAGAGVAQTVTPSSSKPSSSGAKPNTGTGPTAGLALGPEGNSPGGGSPSSSGSATTVSSGTSSTPSTSTSTPTTSTSTKRAAPVGAGRYAAGFRLDAEWGPVADPRSVDNLTRLQVLKAAGQPQIVYLGARADGKHALFLITMQHVSATGDGRCLPDPDHCHVVEMAAGDTQMIDIPTSIGMQQYALVVDSLAARHAVTFAKATTLRTKVVKAGRKLVADRISAGFNFVRRFTYAARRGVLVYHP